MSNTYGQLKYNDFTKGAGQTTVTLQDFALQTKSIMPINLLNSEESKQLSYIKDFATFEPGTFDFTKPIWRDSDKIVCATTTRLFDDLSVSAWITVIPDDKVSSSGFTLKTYNDDYNLTIELTDVNGKRTKSFTKNDFEYYEMPFNDLKSVTFSILAPAGRFLKIIGFSLGRTKFFGEKDLITEPEINNYFSLTNEEMPYDTLDFTVIGDVTNYNIIKGQKVVNTATGQIFYVNQTKYNSEGTIDVSCYDAVNDLEKEFKGMKREEELTTSVANELFNPQFKISGTTLYKNQVFDGVIEPTTKREACRQFMRGNAFSIVKNANNTLEMICPYLNHTVSNTFNENNIVNELPEIEWGTLPSKINFKRTNYVIDKSKNALRFTTGGFDADGNPKNAVKIGYDIVYDAELEHGLTIEDTHNIRLDVPTLDRKVYIYIGPIDETTEFIRIDGKQKLTFAKTKDGEVVEDVYIAQTIDVEPIATISESGAWYIDLHYDTTSTVIRPSTINVLVTGRVYRERNEMLTVLENVPSFNEEEITIDDIKLHPSLSNEGNYNKLRQYLKYIYQFCHKITLDSVLNVNVGEYVRVKFYKYNFVGWITAKKDRMNGIYTYEIMCKESK